MVPYGFKNEKDTSNILWRDKPFKWTARRGKEEGVLGGGGELTGKGGSDVGCPRRVGKIHLITIDGVWEQLSIHGGDASLNVELADEAGLYDELGNVVHLK